MIARTAEKRFGAMGRMGLVAALHVAALFALARSFGIVPTIATVPDNIETTIIEKVQRLDPPPQPIDYKPENSFRIEVPVPEPLPPAHEMTPDAIIAEAIPLDRLPVGPGTADPEPVNVFAARADPRRPLSQPPYPAELIRSGTEGFVDVEVFVQPNGRVGDARIVRSSGYELFDRATLNEARRNWRLLPATRNGEPFAQWYRLRVVFKLKSR
jgi:protein TonB